ncbi:CoB--CoM heterodisulfide reductase iron-sulfur subunit B family protein [Clostridium lacusfryxellense]|uniref:CoB--CoM heterodisulfide reductase iron-sulfur subunit B family protein n=1 Tax=Clostridium lacusfryxellense TaxID=205328 RepID=UPI001C0C49D3|nr:CoB--CoM heterodisulfide reductase iron-sulfur subunit B family protein [Clostridium lacusfryxellense]MBU3112407.1 CoB--CoM heterodisulfide reductase iron-sulfur subunit B family protein [Clostridium lacusfryxellense]
MKYSYYPGCTLKTKAQELEKFALDSAKVLGFELEEQKEWQCCGAVYPMATDEIATKLSAVRSLTAARDKGEKLVTLCSACHHVIKRVNHDMKTKNDIRTKVNNYLELTKEYEGETEVLHYLEVLRDEIGFDELAKKVTNPLTNRKIGAYYGCLLLRPSSTMNFDDPENPSIIEDFIKAIGATPVIYPYRTECCGGYLCLDKKELVNNMSNTIIESALKNDVSEVVTACPLCKYNLEIANDGAKNKLSISYFTELLAEALGVK